MEAVNEGCKLVAQAKDKLIEYLRDVETIEHYQQLADIVPLLNQAIDKLAV